MAANNFKNGADKRGMHSFSRRFDNLVVDCLEDPADGARTEGNFRSIRHGYGLRARASSNTGRREVSDSGGSTRSDWGFLAG
jgi:hypothetical protein